MKRVVQVLLLCCTLLAFSSLVAWSAEITVDASTSTGDINTRIFGHNVRYFNNAVGLWDAPDAQHLSGRTNLSALQVMQGGEDVLAAGAGQDALVRFPGGNYNDLYHWRRGVGPLDKRPDAVNPWDPNDSYSTHFGTDELMMMIGEVTNDPVSQVPKCRPLIGVNWWGWNNPDVEDEFDPAAGVREAANWVEYCNGRVDVPSGAYDTVLLRAVAENWEPSRFIDEAFQNNNPPPPYADSQLLEAVEWAGTWAVGETTYHSWRSYEVAPDGYFAWLRYKFLTEEHGVSPASEWALHGYNVEYWEIGNECYKYEYGPSKTPLEPAAYRGYTSENQPPNEQRLGVIPYSVAMKAKDPNIKIGAVMDDRANNQVWSSTENRWVKTYHPTTSTWDTTVLNADSKAHIDFISCHLGIGGNDDRYSMYVNGIRRPGTSSIYLEEGTYTFRVRAKGTPKTNGTGQRTDYPLMIGWLIKGGGAGLPNESCTVDDWDYAIGSIAIPMEAYLNPLAEGPPPHDNRNPEPLEWLGCPVHQYNGNSYWIYTTSANPSVPGASQEFTEHDPNSNDHDYVFTWTVTESGDYVPWFTMPNNPRLYPACTNLCGGEPDHNGRSVAIKLITYQKDGWSTPVVYSPRAAGDQTGAVYAASKMLGRRVAALREYIDGEEGVNKPQIEIGVTEYGYGWVLTADEGQNYSLKAAIASADLAATFLNQDSNGDGRPDVDFAAYWCMHNMAQNEEHEYDPIVGTFGDGRSDSNFLSSAVAQFYGLFNNHFQGAERLNATVQNVGTYFHTAFDGIAAPTTDPSDATPYLSTLASAALDSTGTYFEKLYVMVINKHTPGDAEDDSPCSIVLQGVAAEPSEIKKHVLGSSSSDLDTMNVTDSLAPKAEVVTAAITPSYTYGSDQTLILNSIDFPPGTVTVLEVSLSEPIGPALNAANGTQVNLKGKYVTAVLGDRFYVEEPSRTSGIAVKWSGTMPDVEVGDKITTLQGEVRTEDGERYIDLDQETHDTGTGVSALGMANKWLGGVSPSQPAALTIRGGLGLYNVGLLVNIWGRVTTTATTHFYVSDGSNVDDGMGTVGVKVIPPVTMEMPSVGQYVWVTGISGAEVSQNGTLRVLRMRGTTQGADWDLVPGVDFDTHLLASIVEEWNWIPISGVPFQYDVEQVIVATAPHVPIELQGNLRRYHWDTSNWIIYDTCTAGVFGNCVLGDVLLLWRPPGDGDATVEYSAASPEWSSQQQDRWDQWVSLPEEGQMFVASPLPKSVFWADCRFTDGVEVKTPAQAYASGWINSNLTGTLQPHTAYEIITNRTGLALIVRDPD